MTRINTSFEIFGAYHAMFLSAAEVITVRTSQMLIGTMSGSEAAGMLEEKATAFSDAAHGAAIAALTGDPMRVAMAMLAPYQEQVALNVARLRA
jgi:hypothetical protein